MNQSFTTIFKLISNQYSTFSEWVKFLISKVHGKKKLFLSMTNPKTAI